MNWSFHPEALDEYRTATQYYARRNPELAARCVEAVVGAIQQMLEHPLAGRVLEDEVRRCLTRVFPYGVLYSVEGDEVLIVAVMHTSRRPGYWRGRAE
ncbi:MAG: type II toxin-antitoxin system RelE/ParE family toxin [Chloroflexota bacterium]